MREDGAEAGCSVLPCRRRTMVHPSIREVYVRAVPPSDTDFLRDSQTRKKVSNDNHYRKDCKYSCSR
ncbi:conserved protein of unknown function [Ectopseudomonas oleovorans]|uniref:Uncharacterized protein n=1 Tax=Ectopseudomonas oleovorans TaxID=301 RepID=A0A653AYI9_ECTOL|nr:conserved protein of unknown function [Pseudomonas oleovorans]